MNRVLKCRRFLVLLLASFFIVVSEAAAQSEVTGIVRSAADNQALLGVTVQVKGSTNSTATDAKGHYVLRNVSSSDSLLFTYVGFATESVLAGNRREVNISLQLEASSLDQVVVVGYGTQKAATVTGAISSVNGEKLQVSHSVNFTNTLVGRLPGLVANTRSGLPGSDDATLRIRGNNTLGDNSPLIVIDGIANRSMSRLNSSDIESVTILKDASAAIYGAQAANGVILITTKRGSTSKLKVGVEFNQGFSSPTVLPKMADSYLYATMLNEVDMYAGQPLRFNADDLQKYKDGSDPWGHPNTDWFKTVFKPVSLESSADINLRGGGESAKYFISIGTRKQDATYRKSGSNYSQIDFRSNIDVKVSNDIKLSINLAGRQENRKGTIYSNYSTFRNIPRGKPTDVAWWFNGLPGPDVENGYNPALMVTDKEGSNKEVRYIMESNLKLDLNIPWIKGLKVTGNAAFDKNFQTTKLWQVPFYLYVWDKVTLDADGLPLLSGSNRGPAQPLLDQSMLNGQNVTLNALVNYEINIAQKHDVKILAGTESSVGKSMGFSASRKYFISSAIDELFAGGNREKDNSGSATNSARLNYFGRVNYDYLSKYLLEFVWRYDGSFRFPADKRWGFFPGVSGGWVISKENFWEDNLGFLNFFKIRGSWGQTGNDRIAAFQYLSVYGFGANVLSTQDGNNFVTNGNTPNSVLIERTIPNLNVTWEVANQTDIGFNAEMLNGKLKLEGDYFYNLRSNILTQRNASIPQSAGLTLPPENIGKVVNRGYEFVVSYSDKIGELHYNVSINGGWAKNYIKFWDETPGIPIYQQTTGHPMNSRLYYQAIGIFSDQAAVDKYPHWAGARAGDVIFKDVNEDGKINGLDMVRDYRSDIPTFTGGLNIDLGYKNFYATVLIQGATGKMRYHYVEGGVSGNYYLEDAEGRWTPDNINASKPRAFNYTAEYWRGQDNTYWLRSADYVRLKNIEIGYSIPESFSSKLKIDGLRIYVGGLNLLTYCPTLPSFDPESIATDYPLNKVINVGATLNF
jgi:TonB-linked SusC/RagA family outer membrane protein